MIVEVTHQDKQTIKQIDAFIGKPFGFLTALKMGGIGSKRMTIQSVSSQLEHTQNSTPEIKYCNIELRPKGIIVRINKGLKDFAWVILYPHLSIFKSKTYNIHAQGVHMHLNLDRYYQENISFLKKLLRKKTEFTSALSTQP